MIYHVIVRELLYSATFYNEREDNWVANTPTLYPLYAFAEEIIELKNLSSSTVRIRKVEISPYC